MHIAKRIARRQRADSKFQTTLGTDVSAAIRKLQKQLSRLDVQNPKQVRWYRRAVRELAALRNPRAGRRRAHEE